MRSNILFIQEPMLKAYLHIGMPFSIVPIELKESGWIYNTYVQLVYYNNNPEDAFMDFTQQRFWEEFQVFTKGFLRFPAKSNEERMAIMSQIKDYIDMGFYLFGLWDECISSSKE